MFFFIPEFERAAKISKIAVYRFLKEQYLAFRGSWQPCGKLFTNNVSTCAEAEIIVHVLRVVGPHFSLGSFAQSFWLEMEEPMDNSQKRAWAMAPLIILLSTLGL